VTLEDPFYYADLLLEKMQRDGLTWKQTMGLTSLSKATISTLKNKTRIPLGITNEKIKEFLKNGEVKKYNFNKTKFQMCSICREVFKIGTLNGWRCLDCKRKYERDLVRRNPAYRKIKNERNRVGKLKGRYGNLWEAKDVLNKLHVEILNAEKSTNSRKSKRSIMVNNERCKEQKNEAARGKRRGHSSKRNL